MQPEIFHKESVDTGILRQRADAIMESWRDGLMFLNCTLFMIACFLRDCATTLCMMIERRNYLVDDRDGLE